MASLIDCYLDGYLVGWLIKRMAVGWLVKWPIGCMVGWLREDHKLFKPAHTSTYTCTYAHNTH